MKTCPYCAEEIQDAAVVCRYCNRPQPGYETDLPPAVKDSGSSKTLLIALLAIGAILIAGAGSYLLFGGSKLITKIFPNLPVNSVTGQKSCYLQSEDYFDQVTKYVTEWDDAEKVASGTSRIALSPAVMNLQRIRREVDELTTPECAEYAQFYLVSYMDTTIEAYLLFMTEASDSTISRKFDEASGHLDSFTEEFIKLKTQPTP